MRHGSCATIMAMKTRLAFIVAVLLLLQTAIIADESKSSPKPELSQTHQYIISMMGARIGWQKSLRGKAELDEVEYDFYHEEMFCSICLSGTKPLWQWITVDLDNLAIGSVRIMLRIFITAFMEDKGRVFSPDLALGASFSSCGFPLGKRKSLHRLMSSSRASFLGSLMTYFK